MIFIEQYLKNYSRSEVDILHVCMIGGDT